MVGKELVVGNVVNSVYYVKERKTYIINETHSDLRHVTIAQQLGWGICSVREYVHIAIVLPLLCTFQ